MSNREISRRSFLQGGLVSCGFAVELHGIDFDALLKEGPHQAALFVSDDQYPNLSRNP
jgi:hypothetical protein